MPEQNFEQQVRQKMDELHLEPSAPVWDRVAEEIRPEKRRRRLLLLWLLPLLLVAGGATWFFLGETAGPRGNDLASGQNVKKNAPLQAPNAPVLQIDKQVPTEITNLDVREQKETGEAAGVSGKINKDAHTPIVHAGKVNQGSFNERPHGARMVATVNFAGAKKTITKSTPVTVRQNKQKKSNAGLSKAGDRPVDSAPDPGAQKISGVPLNDAQAAPAANSLVTALDDATVQTMPGDSAKAAPSTTPASTTAHKRMRPWKITVTAGTGSVHLGETFSLSMNKNYRESYNAGFVPGIGSRSPEPLPETGAGSFTAGAWISWPVARRMEFRTGLHYSLYRTSSQVGAKNDTLMVLTSFGSFQRDFYGSGVQNTHFNNRHFVEIPVGIQYQLLRNKPLFLQGEVRAAALLSAATLMYDPNLQIYYKDNSNNRRMLYHVGASAAYRVWQRKNIALQGGPYFRYSLNALQKESQSKHLVTAGLQVALTF